MMSMDDSIAGVQYFLSPMKNHQRIGAADASDISVSTPEANEMQPALRLFQAMLIGASIALSGISYGQTPIPTEENTETSITAELQYDNRMILSWNSGYLHSASSPEGPWRPYSLTVGPSEAVITLDAQNQFFQALPAITEPISPGPVEGENWTLPISDDVTMELIWVAPGDFIMGSPDSEQKRNSTRGGETQHHVTLTRGYWLGRTEVTQQQWIEIMGTAVPRSSPALWPLPQQQQGLKITGPAPPQLSENPPSAAHRMRWYDCMEFCRRLTARERRLGRISETMCYTLPTSAQWEFACRERGQATGPFHYGDGIHAGLANIGGSPYPKGFWSEITFEFDLFTRWKIQVGLFEPNSLGFYDMHGNVQEWCFDFFNRPAGDPVTDPIISAPTSSNTLRSARGGSYYHAAEFSRAAANPGENPLWGSRYTGFRLSLQTYVADHIGPELVISRPIDGHLSHDRSILIEGTFTDTGRGDNRILLGQCNGEIFHILKQNNMEQPDWSYQARLNEGPNKLFLTIADTSHAMNMTTKGLTIHYDSSRDRQGPAIVLRDDTVALTYYPAVRIRGTSSDSGYGDNDVSETVVGGRAVEMDYDRHSGNYRWDTIVPLEPGMNRIEVSARDNSVNRNRSTIVVPVEYIPN